MINLEQYLTYTDYEQGGSIATIEFDLGIVSNSELLTNINSVTCHPRNIISNWPRTSLEEWLDENVNLWIDYTISHQPYKMSYAVKIQIVGGIAIDDIGHYNELLVMHKLEL